MFAKTKGKSFIQDGLTMWFPPMPDKEGIDGWHLPKKEQYFRRTPIPNWYDALYKTELKKQETQPNYIDLRCEQFRVNEWEKRLNGYWFYNNGEPTYITGANYFFWNWCKLDVGHPVPLKHTRENFYFREYCINDPRCNGYFMIMSRGSFKTTEEVAHQLEVMTRPPKQMIGLFQCTTDDDATRFFTEKHISIFKSLPHFFKPNGEIKTNEISFFKKGGSKSTGFELEEDEELANRMYVINGTEKAADGRTVRDFLCDEIGKAKKENPIDVYERLLVNVQCVNRNGRKFGIIRNISTIEEIEAGHGNEQCYKVWRDSDQDKRDENGATKTTLYRRFLPTYKTSAFLQSESNYDIYGNIDEEKALKYHKQRRKALEDDVRALLSYCRKFPFTIEECFSHDNITCEFNPMILNYALNEIQTTHASLVRAGRFEWEVKGKKVRWVDALKNSEKARVKWNLSYYPTLQNNIGEPTYDNRNQRNIFRPLNCDKFVISTDPINMEKKDTYYQSNAAATIFRKFDSGVDDYNLFREYCAMDVEKFANLRFHDKFNFQSHTFVGDYLYRPDDPREYYEDMAMACIFFGCKLLPERNTQGITGWFEDNGFAHFLMRRPKASFTLSQFKIIDNDYGVPSNGQTIDIYINLMKSYIDRHGHRIKHQRIIKDLIDFQAINPRKFDMSVAACFAMFDVEKYDSIYEEEEVDETIKFIKIKKYKRYV